MPRRHDCRAFESPSPLRIFLQLSSTERINRAEFPPTRLFGGTSLVTTEPAATTESPPTVTPPMMVAPAAIERFAHHDGLSDGDGVALRRFKGMALVMMLTFGPIITSSAISSPPRS